MSASAKSTQASLDEFLTRWKNSGGAERANYQSFIIELCDLLGVARPDPATEDDLENAYTFDRAVTRVLPDGGATTNFIDCYKRGCFVLETKQGVEAKGEQATANAGGLSSARKKSGHGVRGTHRYDIALQKAYNQAERYVRALPDSEGIPPFIVVVDIGHSFEIRSDFSRSRKTYVPFPDPQTFRVGLNELARPEVRERLKLIFTDPMALDPSRNAARVTREVAAHLAELSKSLEENGYEAERTAQFLMRCIFTMFAEDVELIPKDGFRNILKEFTLHTSADRRLPTAAFIGMVRDIWGAMDTGDFSVNLKQKLQRFNGGLFADTEVLPLNENQITMLYNAASCEWRDVEPAIFGTLLERALNAKERHKLGAHYTPRAYVERLVLPTVIEPLREDWDSVLAAAVMLDGEGKWKQAVQECRDFLYRLTQTLVLDPACGTGNFLYVTLDHMKRLEGEVRNAMASFTGSHQAEIEASEFQVDPHQFLGIEVNPRAAAIAELVLWIGYLQWQIKALGTTRLPEPLLMAYHNIDCSDAVLSYTGVEPHLDANGQPVTRWDGETKKLHPVTGEWVPDETARVPVLEYVRPMKTEWPFAHFIVGNPPFLGTARMRAALGDGYAEALRATYPDVPESADFVMYWWHKAANYLQHGWRRNRFVDDGAGLIVTDPVTGKERPFLSAEETKRALENPRVLHRFGFITTNSLRQTFNRRVLQHHMTNPYDPISLIFAIPDHPWVESADGAAVRIAMTVAQPGKAPGVLQTVITETSGADAQLNNSTSGTLEVTFSSRVGMIYPDLTIGAAVVEALRLKSNSELANRGVSLFGAGFIVTKDEAAKLDVNFDSEQCIVVRPYRNGRDLTQLSRNVYVIDLYGLSAESAAHKYPAVYQWVYNRVKPERDTNARESRRRNWWLFGETNPKLRDMLSGLPRYIATVETSKHRFFGFLDAAILPDNKLVNIALSDAYYLGVLSSRFHVIWAIAAGGNLGVGNDPVYVKTRCFETFPFPSSTSEQTDRIRDCAERLDALRKQQQALHPTLTLTDCYNVLEKLRADEPLTPKDRKVHEEGLVTVLLQLHNELDKAVAEAYGWPADLTDDEILTRLVQLNGERAAEEAQGTVRYLRPEYQNPAAKTKSADKQQELLPDTEVQKPATRRIGTNAKREKTEKLPWPATLPEQAKAVQNVMREHVSPTAREVAAYFKGAKVKPVEQIMETLAALGQVG